MHTLHPSIRPGNVTAAAKAGGLPSPVTPVPAAVAETVKLLKRLGYPESQCVYKASSLLDKVNTSLTKRMAKLDETKQLLMKPETQGSQLATKTFDWIYQNTLTAPMRWFCSNWMRKIPFLWGLDLLRICEKIQDTYNEMDAQVEKLIKESSEGIVSGFSEECGSQNITPFQISKHLRCHF